MAFTFMFFVKLNAQNDNSQMYNVHEDFVKPSMMVEYEDIGKELIAALKEHNISDVNWIALSTNEFRYAYLSPIDNMGDMDKNLFGELSKKMGGDKLANLFKRMDKCYYDHINYVLTLDKELSYMPEGITQVPEGENYRENGIYYFSPENYPKAVELAKEYKELYAKKGSKLSYRIYHSGFGSDGSYMLVAMAAKDPIHFHEKMKANRELLGEDAKKIQMKMLKLMDRSDMMIGWIRPDLGYSSSSN